MQKQYIIYLRKSRQDLEAEARGEGDTLMRHRQTLTEFAAARALPVSAIYEEVVSGDTIAGRPQMKRLLQEVEKGLWAGVIVMEIERLARGDSVDQGVVARAFKYSETLIVTPMKTYDPTNEFDEEYFEFGLFMSRREYKTIRRRLSAGVQAARREGKYTAGVPPYGYRKIKLQGEKGGSLEINEETAPLVRNIFHWFVEEGQTIAEIKHRLNLLDPPPPGERNRWYDRRISLILRNPHYAGYTTGTMRPSRTEVIGGQLKQVRLKEKEYAIYEGRHEAIVPREQWNRAQELLKRNFTPPVPRGKGQKNAFVGMLRCGNCGRSMQRTSFSPNAPVRREPIVFCLSRSACSTISHRYDEVETLVLETLESWLKDYSVPGMRTDFKLETQLADTIAAQKKQLAALDAREARLYELVEAGAYTPEIFVQRKSALDDERAALLSRTQETRAELSRLGNDRLVQDEFLPRLRKVLRAYPQAENAAEQNKLLKTVIKEIVYTKNERVTSVAPGNLNLTVYPLLPHSHAQTL